MKTYSGWYLIIHAVIWVVVIVVLHECFGLCFGGL